MKRILIALALVAALAAAPANPASAADDSCTKGEVQRLAQAGTHFAAQHLEGSPAAAGDAWVRCQFRLYDDNDEDPDNPEVAHVFTTKDHFLAGIFYFELYDAFDRPDYDRAAAISYLDSITTRFFFGPASVPDAGLPELTLTHTGYRSGVFPLIGGHVVWNHRYAVFGPGSLPAGEYKWRFEEHNPAFGEDFIARGSVVVLPGG